MELELKERTERKKQNESVERKTNTNTNSVVITVYSESVTTRSRRQSEDSTNNPRFRSKGTAGSQGYDRRALLLAHSRQLRNEGSQKLQLPTNHSQPKTKSMLKGIWLSQLVRICSRSSSTQMPPTSSTWGNERVAFKERKERNPIASPFLSKMKNKLKQLSCKEI
ncbi:hypothetical protein CR513_37832, partial [Mucuna pruriens]